ncbi:2-C-methyl-D-erythritol 4-phosphate cytidylyltransferase [Agrococcus sp. SL85]|uniref:2-C-methyl-D-erythritol 4-phosphate cytidylyltransferase n=1 Tax=Agrococcus sp. SL85 TaxID=2995141 RepID=UPI00226D1DD5|nr:2-C-methyl-D-erythritol 4-phosphate cytidylyltransferase [Agrococcus sp. SL85]WAC66551.1 2-C-methyl-D-erythritol 4-phosphate cytidylyltransferase [Agrococcus sp. SL85]
MTATALIVVAAGSGTRLGRGVPKAFATVAGAPVLEHALRGLAGVDARIVVVAPAGGEAEARAIAARAGVEADVVAGGATRADSVAAGLEAAEGAEHVLVHDAARALAPRALVERVLAALRAGAGAVVPVLPVVDTIRAAEGEALGAIVDRAALRAMQTPQGFEAALLRRAYAAAGEGRAASTDDAQLVQALGEPVVAVPGDELAFKITTPADADRAAMLLGPATRVGIGVDVHAFGGDGPLRVAGLEWEGQGLAGHSDGDVVCHAIVDALLGAAGLGDIGGLVGVDDPQHAGARGETFVRLAVERLAEHGWRPQSVSVQVLGVRPRIGARRDEAQAVLAAMVGAPVSVSGTTTDGLGALGRGEGLQAIATALVARA